MFHSVNSQGLASYLPSRTSASLLIFLGPNGGLQERDVVDDTTLKEWLGDQSTSAPAGLATKKDPKCRFM